MAFVILARMISGHVCAVTRGTSPEEEVVVEFKSEAEAEALIAAFEKKAVDDADEGIADYQLVKLQI